MALDDLDPDALYHLATPGEWARYRADGEIRPASLVDEGFVHCSWGRQVAGTVGRHFDGVEALLALELDGAELGQHLVEEDSYGSGSTYPHVYAPVPVGVVLGTTPVV